MLLHLDVNLNVCVSNFLSKNQSPGPHHWWAISLSHSKSVFNICSKNTIFDFLFLHKMEHVIHGVSMVVDIVIICKYDIFQKQILNSFFPTPTTSLHNDTVQICLVLNIFDAAVCNWNISSWIPAEILAWGERQKDITKSNIAVVGRNNS